MESHAPRQWAATHAGGVRPISRSASYSARLTCVAELAWIFSA
jgi:hypothetical protein